MGVGVLLGIPEELATGKFFRSLQHVIPGLVQVFRLVPYLQAKQEEPMWTG